MKKSLKKRSEKKADPSHQNSVVVGVFAGVMMGFLTAMLLNAFKIGEESDVTEWIQASSSVVAALISAYAVFLVAQTLKSTRDTLVATQAMAEDQRRIGEAQTRPYLLVEAVDIVNLVDEVEITIAFRNFGATPATSVQVKSDLVISEYYQVTEDEWMPDTVGGTSLRSDYWSVVAQSSVVKTKKIIKKVHFDFGQDMQTTVDVTWRYRDHDGSEVYDGNKYIYFEQGPHGEVLISSSI